MSDYIVQSESLTTVANKIREVTGKSGLLEFPDGFVDGIDSLIKIPGTPDDSILFYSFSPFTIGITNKTKNWDGAIYYSLDHATWTEWNGNTDIVASLFNRVYVIYLKGSDVSYFNQSSIKGQGAFNIIGSGIKCVGNLNKLIDKSMLTYPQYFCAYMFYNCASIDFDIILPFTSFDVSAYESMFEGCLSLTKAPALPATTLSNYCYYFMFKSCKMLLTPPALPALSVAGYSYYGMFEACVNLKTAPELPATTIQAYSYNRMFMGCTSLTVAPALPAETLATYCYTSMFSDCTSLITPPTISAVTLEEKCCASMFYNCTALTTAPALLATTAKNYCYQSMFMGCTALVSPPALPATTLNVACYQDMFRDCVNLTSINALPATQYKSSCYVRMYQGCTKIKLSTTQVDEYQTEYKIPSSGTGTSFAGAFTDMFKSTGGTFTGTPTVNTTYYTSNTVVPAT